MPDSETIESESPSTQPSTEPTIKPAPYITVADAKYKRVGDFTFGANKKIDDAPIGPILGDQIKMAQWVENQVERTIRELLEKDGLRLHRNDTWVIVMNRVRKNLYEILEYQDEENGGWHIFRKGKLIAKISYPWFDANRHLKIQVS